MTINCPSYEMFCGGVTSKLRFICGITANLMVPLFSPPLCNYKTPFYYTCTCMTTISYLFYALVAQLRIYRMTHNRITNPLIGGW